MPDTDRRVVEMRFDNAQFKKGVNETVQDMNRLDRSMEKDTSSDKFDAVKNALGVVANGVEKVSSKFNAMGVVAASALNRITNDAITAGKNIAKSLTIQPMIDGFHEYETQMGSIQTILANTQHDHTNLDDVNKSLDELNTYADKTIYNFTEMTRNIGTFTAAGVKLKPATKAIQGIANLGAVSGSTSEQTSRVMYQLSQALAAGKVNLMDWNSVVNGGMGGKVFQDALIRTSEAYGTGAKKMIEAQGSFRDSLSTKAGEKSWLTSKVLVDTLNQFAGVYSKAELIQKGFTKSQANEILKMGKTAEKAATEVKSFSALIDTTKEELGSGWTQSWEYIIGDFNQSKKLFTGISQEINKVIQSTANQRNRALKGWNQDKISKSLAHNGFEDNDLIGMTGRQAAIKGLTNLYKAFATILGSVHKAWTNVFPPATAKLLTMYSAEFYKFTKRLSVSKEAASGVTKVFQTLFEVLDSARWILTGAGRGLLSIFKGVWTFISKLFGPLLTGLADATNLGMDLTNSVAIPLSGKLEEIGESIGDFIAHLADGVPKAETFREAFEAIGRTLSGFFNSLSGGKDKVDDFGSTMESAGSSVSDWFKGLFSGSGSGPDISGPIEAVTGALSDLGGAIKDALSKTTLGDIFNGVIAAFAGKGVIELIKTFKAIREPFENAGGFIADVKEFMGVLKGEVIKTFQAFQNDLNSNALLKIAAAIGVMALSLSVMAKIPSESLLQSVAAISSMAIILGGLMSVMVVLSNEMEKSTGLTRMSGSMIPIAASIMIMAGAMQKIGSMKWDELQRGIIGLGAAAGMLTVVMYAMSEWDKSSVTGALALLIFSGALVNVTKAISNLGSMDPAQLAIGLGSVGAILGVIAAIVTKSDLQNATLMAGLGITAIAEGINIMSDAVMKLGGMDVESLLKGVGAVSALLAVMTFMASRDLSAKMLLVGAGLFVVAQAMVGIVGVVQTFGGMPIEQLAQGLISMAAAIAILALGLDAMDDALAGAAAMLVAAAAINILVPAIQALGSLDITQVVVALAALAGTFAIFGEAAALLEPVLPAMLGLGAALMMMGAGLALASIGLATFGAAIGVISNTIGQIVSTIVTAIVDFTSQLASHAAEISGNILTMVGEFLSQFVTAVEENLPKIIESAGTIITEFITGLFEAIGDNAPKIIKAAADMIIQFIRGIGSNLIRIIRVAYQTIIKFINGLADAVNEYQPQLNRALKRLIDAVINGLKDFVKVMLGKGGAGVSGFIKGLGQHLASVSKKAGEIKDRVLDAVKGAGDWLYNTGKHIIEGLTNGIDGFIGNVTKSAEDIANKVKDGVADFLGIHSPSRVMYKQGRWVVIGFANGIKQNQRFAVEAVTSFSDAIAQAYSTEPMHVPSRIDSALANLNTSPTIRPVMDLDMLKDGVWKANRLLASSSYGIDLGALGSSAVGLKMASSSVVNNNKISLSVSVPVSQVGQSVDTNRLANDVASSIADALNKRLATQGR